MPADPVQVDDSALLALIDRLSEGAGSAFIGAMRPPLERIRGDAQAKWPVRTGQSKASFKITEQVTETEIAVSLLNDASSAAWGPYAYKIRYSIWTKADLALKVNEAASRATTPTAEAAIRDHLTRKLRRAHGEGAPDEASAGKSPWVLHVRRPLKPAIAAALPVAQKALLRLGDSANG